MTQPWIAEHTVTSDLARALIERQFPALAPAWVEPFGVGWDNTAYLVNDLWVFRFPRRAVAADLIRAEAAILPVIAPRLPLAIPVPCYVGEPEERFPCPFAGYRMIAGQTACDANLDEGQRSRAAEPLADFLRALHSVPRTDVEKAGAGPDTIGRLDVPKRRQQIIDRLREAKRKGLARDVQPWLELADDAPPGWTSWKSMLVHGDFYARHLLVDETGAPNGVIDWGDVHLGDPAVDLSIAHGFLPPAARAAFRAAYGTIDDDTWRMARFKALHAAVMVLVYAADVGDADLLREGRMALGYVLG
jgi:aminoglycoside phosphotransferase (APT) family kinase protein